MYYLYTSLGALAQAAKYCAPISLVKNRLVGGAKA
jgi:hypothetical protein